MISPILLMVFGLPGGRFVIQSCEVPIRPGRAVIFQRNMATHTVPGIRCSQTKIMGVSNQK